MLIDQKRLGCRAAPLVGKHRQWKIMTFCRSPPCPLALRAPQREESLSAFRKLPVCQTLTQR